MLQSTPVPNGGTIQNTTQELSVTLKKPWWENIGALLWGMVKIIFILALFGILFQSAEVEDITNSFPYQKNAIDEYYRDVAIDPNAQQIAIINIEGMITDQDIAPGFAEGMVVTKNIIGLLADAAEDTEISAILLKINSPGGEVGASERLATHIEHINTTQKPVYVLMETLSASGGYYISTPASKIYAYPETLLGNIGVRIDIPNMEGLLGNIGIEMQSVHSGELKDMGSPFRAMKEQEKEIFANLVDESYQTFINRVSEGRNLPLETVKQLADGRIYSGVQAEQNGLIDMKVSSLSDVILDLRTEMGTSVQLVEIHIPLSPWEEFLMTVSNTISPLQANIKDFMGVSMKYQ